MITLFCFASAGDVASDLFSGWGEALGDDVAVVPVDYPGRGLRTDDSPVETARHLVDDAIDFIRRTRRGGDSWALFGHSLGALVAYEVASELGSSGLSGELLALIASGRRPPGDPSTVRISELDDVELIDRAASWGGIPRDFLARSSLRPLIVERLRRDLRFGESQIAVGPPLSCPVIVLGGAADPLVEVDSLARWDGATRATATVHLFDGDHFFLRSRADEVTAVVGHALRELAREPTETILEGESR